MVKAQPKLLQNVAARVFLLKTDPFSFSLHVLKGGFTALVISSFITVNPIRDLSMIDKKPLKLETQALSEFSFKKIETMEQKKVPKLNR